MNYALKHVLRSLLNGGSDVLNQAGTQSLEQPLGENSEGNSLLIGDVVPDERTAEFLENVDRIDEYTVLYEAIDSLPDIERRVIIEHYFKNLSFAKIGRIHGFTAQRANQAHKRALWLLRRGRTGRKLWELYGNEYNCSFNGSICVKHKSVRAFKRSRTSEIEDYVAWLMSHIG